MPEPRIAPQHILAVKSWIENNRSALSASGIDRIDAHYTNDDLDIEAVDEIHAYAVTDGGSTFREVAFEAGSELKGLLEALTVGDEFFQGQQGAGGTFRLLIQDVTIEHASFEYVTTQLEHDVEIY